ncbi:hypothetical protein Tco_0315528 [Tanacetum coccineum]
MLDKQNDPISIEKKIKISPIDYSKLNKIKEYFGKRFVTKKELYVEQAFWLKHSSISETPVTSHTPVRIEAPSELPKASLLNESLKKLKYQLANFDKVVKNRTTSDAIITDTFNAFDKTLLDEITEVQIVFNQIEAVVDQCSSQEKDMVIRKLKDRIKSLGGKDSVENVKKDIDEIETINIELEHSQFDSIRKTRVQSKEHCDSLIAQINAKFVENLDLNAQLQEKVFAIAALKTELRKLKGKNGIELLFQNLMPPLL